MKKPILLIAIMSMAMLAPASLSLELEVDCGQFWDAAVCSEWELQPLADEVAGLIEELQDSQEFTQDEIDDLWYQLDHIHQVLYWNEWRDRMQDFRLYLLDIKVHRLGDRMTAEEIKPDRQGGGISWGDLGQGLMGDKWFFIRGNSVMKFYRWLDNLFVTHAELEQIFILAGEPCNAAIAKSVHLGGAQTVNGVTYNPSMGLPCVGLTAIE